MTKVSVFGQAEVNKTNLKPIEAVKYISSYGDLEIAEEYDLKSYENVTLLCKRYCNGLDLFIAYDNLNQPLTVILCLGYWNDGIV